MGPTHSAISAASAAARARPCKCCHGCRSVPAIGLAGPHPRSHAPEMFVVSGAEAAAIRAVFQERGELSATLELRRRFPGLDAETARESTRTIAGWEPWPGGLRPARQRPDSELTVEIGHAEHTAIQNPAGSRTPRS